MKHRMGQLLSVVGLTTALLVALAVVGFAGVAQSWHFLGGTPGIVPASVNATTSVAIDSNGTPYIAFVDAGNGEKATVMKYTGGAWTTVGSAGFSPGTVNDVQLAITGTTVYALYRNGSGGLTVDTFNGSTWQHVVSATINSGNGQYPSFALYGNEIFVAYKDWSNGKKLTVMHFDGTNWSPLGGSPGVSAAEMYNSSIAVDSNTGTVYVVYDNYSSLTMMKYTGGAWSVVSTNFTLGGFANVKVDSTGAPVVVFRDKSSGVIGQASVMRYVGGAWSSVGSEGFSGGFAYTPRLAIGLSDRLFVAFADVAAGTKISVMEFDTGTGAWQYVGNRGASVGDIDTGSVSIAVRPDSIVPVIGFMDNGLGKEIAAMQLGSNVAPVGVDDTASVPDSAPSTLLPLENDSDTDGDYLRVGGIITAPLHGTAAISGYTQIVYTPTTGYVGADSLGYIVSDGALTDTATVAITVFGANNAPVGVDDSVVTDEEIALTFSPIANDTDSDGNPLSVTGVTNGKHGTASISGATQVVYTPTTNFYGIDRLKYVVSDGSLTDTATITVTVNPVNDAPRIISPTWQALTGTGFSGGSYVNMAIDHNGTPYIAYIDSSYNLLVKQYTGGAWVSVGATVASPGGIIPLDFAFSKQGVPYVAYRDTSNNLLTVKKYTGSAWTTVGTAARSSGNNVIVSDMVLGFNYADEPLVAYNDGALYLDRFNGTAWVTDSSYPGGFSLGLALNSADVAYVAIRDPGQSFKLSVLENSNGSFSPVGAPGFSDDAVLQPKVELDNNDVPFISFIDNSTITKTLKVMTLSGGTWVPVGDSLADDVIAAGIAMSNGGIPTVMYVTGASQLRVKQFFNGAWSTVLSDTTGIYASELAFSPNDQLYIYADSGANVAKMNATDVTATAVTMDEDGAPTPFSFDTNVFDADNDALTWTITVPPANGMAVGGTTPVYTPTANYNGSDTFTAQVSDGALTDAVMVTVTINPQNDPPFAVDDTLPAQEDVTELLDVLGNDSDVDGQSLAITSVGTATHGAVSIAAGLYIYYIPDANYNGTDTFTYIASDGALTATATTTVTVSPVNDAPVAIDDLVNGSDSNPITISPLDNDSDVDGDTLSVMSVSGALNGTANIVGTTQIVYTPTIGYSGSEILTYVASDGALTDTASITVNITANQPPVAVDDTAATDEDLVVTISPLGNDSDPNGDPLTISAVGAPANGAVSISGTTQLVYTPNLNFYGDDVFMVTVSDGTLTDSAAVTVTVASINDAPVAVGDTAVTDEDFAVTISPLGNDSDVDGDPLAISAVGTPANGAVSISGTTQLVYTPTIGYFGGDTFSYIVSDGSLTATASIFVTVQQTAPPMMYVYLPLVLK